MGDRDAHQRASKVTLHAVAWCAGSFVLTVTACFATSATSGRPYLQELADVVQVRQEGDNESRTTTLASDRRLELHKLQNESFFAPHCSAGVDSWRCDERLSAALLYTDRGNDPDSAIRLSFPESLVAPGTSKWQAYIHAHQHPANCSGQKFHVVHHDGGNAATLHVHAFGLTVALVTVRERRMPPGRKDV